MSTVSLMPFREKVKVIKDIEMAVTDRLSSSEPLKQAAIINGNKLSLEAGMHIRIDGVKAFATSEKWPNVKLNLTRKGAAQALAIKFENHFYDKELDEMSIADITTEVKKLIADEDFYSTYAGGDGFCGTIYEHKNNKLKEVSFASFAEDIAKHIKNNWS